MSNQEKLQSYIACLKNGTSAIATLNSSKNTNLTLAMKAARDMHVRSTSSKADALFVNSLEQKLLLMNAESEVIHVRSVAWQIIPMVGAVALITLFSWKVLKPARDIKSGQEAGTVGDSYITEEYVGDKAPLSVPKADFSAAASTIFSQDISASVSAPFKKVTTSATR